MIRRRHVLAAVFAAACLGGWGSAPALGADGAATEVEILGPYVELRSGPGRGYPVFHTVERGGSLAVIKRRTDWYRVRTAGDVEGWVNRFELETEAAAGPLPGAGDIAVDDYRGRRFELGFASGDFDGDQAFTARAGYRLGEHFQTELALSEVSGTFSSTTLLNANLLVMPMSTWRIAPFFTVGLGRFKNDPKDVLVDDETVDEWVANAGLGLRAWLARRFLLRGDYRRYTVMVDEYKNESFDEWSLGFSVFF